MLNFEPKQWARKNLGGLKLGNIRRSIRVIKFAEKMGVNPGKSITQLSSNSYEAKWVVKQKFFAIAIMSVVVIRLVDRSEVLRIHGPKYIKEAGLSS